MRGGLALTFDDDFIEQWHDQRSLFREFGARVTFFVRQFDRLTPQQLQRLRELAADGHEIGSHSLRHKSVLREYGGLETRIPGYLAEEVLPSIAAMQAAGFTPLSYAFPFGERTPAYDAAVLQHFRHVRRTSYKKHFLPPHWLRSIYHLPGSGERRHSALGIDMNYAQTEPQILACLGKAAATRRVVLFYAHDVREDHAPYSITPQRLRTVFETARRLGLGFYTVAELA